MSPLCLLSIAFFLLSTSPNSDGVALHGQVRYAQQGRLAENVQVRLEALSGGVVEEVRTDRTGKFDFSGLGPATYRITASAAGFHSAAQEVHLVHTRREYLILTLVPDSPGLSVRTGPQADTLLDARVPKQAREEYEKGRHELFARSSRAKAIKHLERAVGIYPDYLQAQLLLGTAYLDDHELQKSESALLRVIKIDTNTAQAHFALGELYLEKEAYPDAERELKEGLRLQDAWWQGHFALARLYWKTGDVPKAGLEVGRSLQLKPDEPRAYLLAGNILLKARKASQALPMFLQYLHLAPKGEYAAEVTKVVENIKTTLGHSEND